MLRSHHLIFTGIEMITGDIVFRAVNVLGLGIMHFYGTTINA